ncbi:MAG: Spy/CpxP family protein refolding chaperone [Bacteroidales bacterium]|nr:Spy/CpxP family protein refolding chaperone [Bacteroidales bacterium]
MKKSIIVVSIILLATGLLKSQVNPEKAGYRWEKIPNLTEEQRSKLQQLQIKHEKIMTDLRNSLFEKKAQLHSAMSGSTADEKKALKLAEEMHAIELNMEKERISHHFAIANLLNNEQKDWWFSTHKPPFKHEKCKGSQKEAGEPTYFKGLKNN